ncbi:MAG TPA: hypothetical protein VLI05_05260 [Candidatus Saccharimonadia bacterium]|nr:hypothetical protein [Candidatus Saccharimonadia bacterium]
MLIEAHGITIDTTKLDFQSGPCSGPRDVCPEKAVDSSGLVVFRSSAAPDLCAVFTQQEWEAHEQNVLTGAYKKA